MGGVGCERKLRVMLCGERVNLPFFPLGLSWVKPFPFSSVKWNTLLREIYQHLKTVGESSLIGVVGCAALALLPSTIGNRLC